MEKILDTNDIEKITIDVYYEDLSEEYPIDIIMRFPKHCGIDPISFAEIGLINASEVEDCTRVLNSKHKILLEQCSIKFFGCLQKHHKNKTK